MDTMLLEQRSPRDGMILHRDDRIAIIEFDTGHRHNPFHTDHMRSLLALLWELEQDPAIRVVALYGGRDRSFSVGGDFKQTSNFAGGSDVEQRLELVAELYTTIASMPQATVAAVTGYAIGFGLQVALLCDYRIGAMDCKLAMPEFHAGLACVYGAYLLEECAGRGLMQRMLFGCEHIGAENAMRCHLLHKIVDTQDFEAALVGECMRLAEYSPYAIQSSKAVINQKIIRELAGVLIDSKTAHSFTYGKGEAQVQMKRIIESTSHERESGPGCGDRAS
ncbi:enoyl-CoA hydratase/isomerase family protein [Nocardia brasiliensis]